MGHWAGLSVHAVFKTGCHARFSMISYLCTISPAHPLSLSLRALCGYGPYFHNRLSNFPLYSIALHHYQHGKQTQTLHLTLPALLRQLFHAGCCLKPGIPDRISSQFPGPPHDDFIPDFPTISTEYLRVYNALGFLHDSSLPHRNNAILFF